MGIYADNTSYGLTLEWSGFAEDRGYIVDKRRGVTTTLSGAFLKEKGRYGFKVGHGNKDFYDGHHILLYQVDSNNYNFDLYKPGREYTYGDYEGRGGAAQRSLILGMDRAFMHDLSGNGTIEGFANFYINNTSIAEGDCLYHYQQK